MILRSSSVSGQVLCPHNTTVPTPDEPRGPRKRHTTFLSGCSSESSHPKGHPGKRWGPCSGRQVQTVRLTHQGGSQSTRGGQGTDVPEALLSPPTPRESQNHPQNPPPETRWLLSAAAAPHTLSPLLNQWLLFI